MGIIQDLEPKNLITKISFMLLSYTTCFASKWNVHGPWDWFYKLNKSSTWRHIRQNNRLLWGQRIIASMLWRLPLRAHSITINYLW